MNLAKYCAGNSLKYKSSFCRLTHVDLLSFALLCFVPLQSVLVLSILLKAFLCRTSHLVLRQVQREYEDLLFLHLFHTYNVSDSASLFLSHTFCPVRCTCDLIIHSILTVTCAPVQRNCFKSSMKKHISFT